MPDTVYSLICTQAQKTPDAPAVLGSEGKASYRDLMERAASVARHLSELGLPAETPIALLMERRTDLVGTILGIWQAGLSYLPIDPQEPPERVRQMLKLADCGTLMGDCDLSAPIISEIATEGFQFVDASNLKPTAGFSVNCARAEGLAYLLFTSGSTGTPKAVEVEHHSLAHVLSEAIDLLGIVDNDCYLACATVGFDISLVELFAPLMAGARLLLGDTEMLLNPALLSEAINTHNVTIMQTGPSVWATLISEMHDFPKLRIAISTGEALWPHQAAQIVTIADTVWNLYGPTETTIWASGHKILPKTIKPETGRMPIGTTLPGAHALICDDAGHEVSDQHSGELLVSGKSVARGYRNQPALTLKNFVNIKGTRYYKTGDIVSRNANGVLHYLGRRDDQIKMRGMRIEPAEIEKVISACLCVQDAAVTWFDNKSGATALVAAIAMVNDNETARAEVSAQMARHLPSQRIPSRILYLPRLPINKNGKVDRAAIRAKAKEVGAQNDPSPALSPTEALVADVWARMMRITTVTSNDNFFAIGGDSLAAVTMTLEVEALLKREISTLSVLKNPVLRDFCAKLDQLSSTEGSNINPDYLFPMVTHSGTNPVFFCGADLRLAKSWGLPVSLCILAYWADSEHIISAPTIEALAGNYVAGIRAMQPKGPYRLAGYSFGAVLAFEIAQQLTAMGEEVSTLVLLDPYKPFNAPEIVLEKPTSHKAVRFLQSRWQNFRNNIGQLNPFRQKNGIAGWFAPFLTPIEKIPGGIRLVYWVNHIQRRHPNPVSAALVQRWQWPVFWFTARKLLNRYHIRPYFGRTLAIFTMTQGGKEEWQQVLPRDAVYSDIAGLHTEIFEIHSVENWLPLLQIEIESTSVHAR